MNLSEIKLNPANPRTIKDEKFAFLKRSIQEFPQMMTLRPIVIDDSGVVLGGNMRLQALKALGHKTIPDEWVKRVDDLTPEQKQEFIIKDNAGFGQWDWDLLANEWSDLPLSDWGVDMPEDWAPTEPVKEDESAVAEMVDAAAELLKKWKVKRGNLYEIGRHRLLCGDSTSAADVARVMNGARATLLASDPPYNVSIDYGDNVDDKKAEVEYEAFSRGWFGLWAAVSDRQIVTPGCYNLARWARYFEPYHVAPWTKTNSMTNGKVARWWCWEPVMFFGDKWPRTRSNDIFDFPIGQQTGVANHPCPKPLKMWVDLLENYSEEGDITAEAFSGGGTSHVAAEQTGRSCYGIEIEPKFCAVILERLSALGLTPKLTNETETKSNAVQER